MRTLSRLAFLALVPLTGCDLILGGYFISEANKKDDSKPAASGLPVVTVVATDPAAMEPADPGTFTFTRTGSTADPLDVFFTTGGSAGAGVDYTALPAMVTIPGGSATETVDVAPIDDFDVEPDETVLVTVTADPMYTVGAPANASVTLSSEDVPPTVTVTASDASAAERPLDPGEFTFTRTDTIGDLDVFFTVDAGIADAATSGSDYQAFPALMVTIPNGSLTATLAVTPLDDTAQEVPEFIKIDLAANAQYIVGAPASATVTLTSEDDPFYHVFVADLADDTEALAEFNATQGNGGDPSLAKWTEVGIAQDTMEFTVPGGVTANAILFNCIDTVTFDIDAVVILDNADGTGIGKAENTIFSDRITDPDNIAGVPDGQVGITDQALLSNKAFFLTRFDSTITRFRIEAWDNAGGPGTFNVAALSVPPTTMIGDQRAEGAAVNSLGRTYITYSDGPLVGRDLELIQVTEAESFEDPLGTTILSLENALPTATGSAAIAIDQSDNLVIIATTRPGGGIRIRQYTPPIDQSSTPDQTANATAGVGDHVHPQGGTLDGNGDFVLAGAIDWGVGTGIGYYLQKFRKSDLATLWPSPATPPPGQVGRAWFAVAAPGTTNIHTAGDFNGASLIDAYARQSLSSNGSEVWSVSRNGVDNLDDRGNAVAVDAAGNVYVGGFVTTVANGRDIAIWKFNSAGAPVAPYPFFRNGSADGDDEVLDLAVEADGTLYAAGYSTITGQGQDWWVAKFNPAGTLAASRTYHGDAGDDRAVNAILTGTSLIVVGHETLGGGDTELLYIRYVK